MRPTRRPQKFSTPCWPRTPIRGAVRRHFAPDCSTGPRGPLFLVEQFSRLAERGIDVYWAGGAVDPPEAWPAALALPQNVHVFPHGRVEDGDGPARRRTAGPAGRRQPRSAAVLAAGRFLARSDGPVHDRRGPRRGRSGRRCRPAAFHYWALGGRHDRSTPLGGPQVVHYCGSPQGRRPEESGVHGCTLVASGPSSGRRAPVLIPTDAVRWLDERIAVDETTSREDLETRLRDQRMQRALLEAAPATALLISWTIAGHGPLMAQLRRDETGRRIARKGSAAITAIGRRRLGACRWRSRLSETLPPEWYEQETIRGDFLRAVRQLQMNPDEPLALESYMAEAHLAGTLGDGGDVFEQSRPRPRAARGGGAGRRPAKRGGAPRMRITDLEVEGYGVWSGLRIEKFSDALNVLYGPNEAGKTTLLQFIRSMLYGFSPARRKYLPPVHGGRPGGVLDLAGPHGRFAIGRYDDSLADGTSGRAGHADRPRRHPAGRAFHQGAAVERRRAGVQQRVRRRAARDSGVGHARATPRPPSCSTASRPDWTACRWSRCCGSWRTRATASSTPPAGRARWSNCWPSEKNSAPRSRNSGRSTAATAIWRPSATNSIRKSRGWRRRRNDAEHLARVIDLAISLRDRWTQRAALDEQLRPWGR